MLVLFDQYFEGVLHKNFKSILSSYCVVLENTHIPPAEGIENFWGLGEGGGGVSQRPKNLIECIKLGG